MSNENFSEKNPRQPSHIAYQVEAGKDAKSHWQKIGAAWPAKNDGLTLKLNSVPLDGRIALRSREELERLRAERQQQQSQNKTINPAV